MFPLCVSSLCFLSVCLLFPLCVPVAFLILTALPSPPPPQTPPSPPHLTGAGAFGVAEIAAGTRGHSATALNAGVEAHDSGVGIARQD